MKFKILAALAVVVSVIAFTAVYTVGTRANVGTEVVVSSPPPQGARCTALPWPKVSAKQIKAYKKQVTDYKAEKPGATRPERCSRLFAKATAKTLPNKPPQISLARVGAQAAPGLSWIVPAVGQLVVTTDATDPDGDSMIYTYSTTGGRFNGAGRSGMWDLRGVAPGIYTITTEVDDGCGCIAFESATAEVK